MNGTKFSAGQSSKTLSTSMRILLRTIGVVIVILTICCVIYNFFGYEGPRGEWTIIAGEKEIVLDGDAKWTMVKKEEILSDPFFLAVWFGKVKRVLVKTEDDSRIAYVWKRSLPPGWNEDFGWTLEVGIAADGPHGCREARNKCRSRNKKGDDLLFLRAFTPSDGNQYWRMAVKPDMLHSTSKGIRDPVAVWGDKFVSARDVIKVLEHYYQSIDSEYPNWP